MDDLLGASPVAESQQWKTKAIWPEMSILEDNCNWDDETKDAEDIHDEEENEKDEEEENEKDEEEEEGDGIGGEEK
ncbi:hypothetical protein G6F37_006852 [Rhizopus arrhizus]|nr:hypothetical protein G6F38_006365 [Rhizopus arrhizus]KAG1157273.1 hypothetical protein G6F37_006852 [Rhizopus arrhizus]